MPNVAIVTHPTEPAMPDPTEWRATIHRLQQDMERLAAELAALRVERVQMAAVLRAFYLRPLDDEPLNALLVKAIQYNGPALMVEAKVRA